ILGLLAVQPRDPAKVDEAGIGREARTGDEQRALGLRQQHADRVEQLARDPGGRGALDPSRRHQWPPPPPGLGFAFQIFNVSAKRRRAPGIIAMGRMVKWSFWDASGLLTRQSLASRILLSGSTDP